MTLNWMEARLRARRDHLALNLNRLVIDGDVHPTDRSAVPPEVAARLASDPDYFHGRPLPSDELLDRMDRAGVDMALCWQNPAMLPYSYDLSENARRLGDANARIAALADAYPTRIIPAGWTDPKALGVDAAVMLARRCIEDFGMPVVKMNPAQNAFPIDDQMVFEVVDAIVELGAVPAFHFGSDTPYTPPEGLAAVARRHPDHPVIAVHMGGGGGQFVTAEPIYQAARQLGLAQSNIFYVLSAIRDVHVESALLAYAAAGAPARNLGVGSDAPYCGMSWTFGAFRALFSDFRRPAYPDARLQHDPELIDEPLIAGFMGGHLAQLLIAAYDRMLAALETRR
jgi:predicted TIM-barrel fold metal-dependent hydrolase